ncbi:hypothetical protein JXA84_06845 [candidate division WOR-3 bacterium]|nr:hypothetical protein [candidate division WOR-3 bacterium]
MSSQSAVFVLVCQEEIPIQSVQFFVDSIADLGVDGIVVEVLKDGQTLFPSDYFDFPFSYDVLEEVVYCAKLKNLLVFFNFDLFRIWTKSDKPTSPSHLINSRPGLFLTNSRGQAMPEFSKEELIENFNVDAYYVSPSIQEYNDLLYMLMNVVSANYYYSGIVLSGFAYPFGVKSYDAYTLTEFCREYYLDPRKDQLPNEAEEEWNSFLESEAEKFLVRLTATADFQGYLVLRSEYGVFSQSLPQLHNFDMIIADSNWITVKGHTPKNLSDVIQARGSAEFLVLDDARDILSILGYKEMIKIGMERLREEGARR